MCKRQSEAVLMPPRIVRSSCCLAGDSLMSQKQPSQSRMRPFEPQCLYDQTISSVSSSLSG